MQNDGSFFFLMIRRPPRSTQSRSSAASDVYKRQDYGGRTDRSGGLESPTYAPANGWGQAQNLLQASSCLLYTSPSPRDRTRSRMPSSA